MVKSSQHIVSQLLKLCVCLTRNSPQVRVSSSDLSSGTNGSGMDSSPSPSELTETSYVQMRVSGEFLHLAIMSTSGFIEEQHRLLQPLITTRTSVC